MNNQDWNNIDKDELGELTQDFLASFSSHTHMSWMEWHKEAESYGLDEKEIAELKQYLEVNKQLTSPIRFAARQWWLTNQEIEHVKLLQQYFPTNWEDEALKRMQRGKLGSPNTDKQLKEREKAKHSINSHA